MLPAGSPLSAWLAWLETLSPREIDLGLERVQDVLSRLELALPPQVLLIAGTNGKGSTVAMSDALLRAAAYRTGCYTSPHIIDYNERIVIDGAPVTDAEIIGAFERIEAVRDGVALTYFEYGTLAAFVLFAARALDAWVLEVGMGGRLDATNAIDPTAALITNVTLDHCDWLGADVETIAAEKAGVMRAGRPVIFGGAEVPESVTRRASGVGADLRVAGRDFTIRANEDGTWDWRGRSHAFERLALPGLPGRFQLGNAAAVLALLEAAGLERALDPDLINRTLPGVSLTGRCQSLRARDRNWLLDVAHNPGAATVLAATLAERPVSGRTIAIIGLLDDKDVEGVVQPLLPRVDAWVAVAPDSRRAIPAADLGRRIANAGNRPCLVADRLDEALEFARQAAGENDRILVTGSFYLVGPVLKRLRI